jgi:hypothetical protein
MIKTLFAGVLAVFMLTSLAEAAPRKAVHHRRAVHPAASRSSAPSTAVKKTNSKKHGKKGHGKKKKPTTPTTKPQ